MEPKLEAIMLRSSNEFAVRPLNQLGTCGWVPYFWTVIYVNANSPEQAIAIASITAKKQMKFTQELESIKQKV